MKRPWHCSLNYSQHYLELSEVTEEGAKAVSLVTGGKLVHLDELSGHITFNMHAATISTFNYAQNNDFFWFSHVRQKFDLKHVEWLWHREPTLTVAAALYISNNDDGSQWFLQTCILNSVLICYFAEYTCGVNWNISCLIYSYPCLFPAAAITQFPRRDN